jgi:aminoglycoside 3-N-acetyltransferase I
MDQITLRKLGNNDLDYLIQLIALYAEVFELDNFTLEKKDHLLNLLNKDETIFYVAVNGNTVVGGLTAYTLPSVYNRKSEVYLYDLAVAKNYQRQGIGTKLIEYLKIYCRTINVSDIFVQADTVDEGALNFYRKIGGDENDVRHFEFNL